MRGWKKGAAILTIAAMMCTAGCGESEKLKRENEELASEAVELESINAEREKRIEELATENEKLRNENEILEELVNERATASGEIEVLDLDASVWIGEGGTKYHREECVTLNASAKKEITLREALEMGRKPCGVCMN